MKSITAAIAITLLVLDWWDRSYNHSAYAHALEAMVASIRHNIGV